MYKPKWFLLIDLNQLVAADFTEDDLLRAFQTESRNLSGGTDVHSCTVILGHNGTVMQWYSGTDVH